MVIDTPLKKIRRKQNQALDLSGGILTFGFLFGVVVDKISAEGFLLRVLCLYLTCDRVECDFDFFFVRLFFFDRLFFERLQRLVRVAPGLDCIFLVGILNVCKRYTPAKAKIECR